MAHGLEQEPEQEQERDLELEQEQEQEQERDLELEREQERERELEREQELERDLGQGLKMSYETYLNTKGSAVPRSGFRKSRRIKDKLAIGNQEPWGKDKRCQFMTDHGEQCAYTWKKTVAVQGDEVYLCTTHEKIFWHHAQTYGVDLADGRRITV